MIDIGQKTLPQIDAIKKDVEPIKQQINYFISLYVRCHEGNIDKNSNFLFDDKDYSNFKSFFEKTQDIIYDIDIIFKEAISNKQIEQELQDNTIVYQENPVPPSELEEKLTMDETTRDEITQLNEMESRIEKMKTENIKWIEQLKK